MPGSGSEGVGLREREGIRLLDFFEWLFRGHVHKWKTIKETNVFYPGVSAEIPVGSRYYQQCEHCGKVIMRNFQ